MVDEEKFRKFLYYCSEALNDRDAENEVVMQNVKRWVKQLYTMEIVADDVLEKLLVPETIRLMQMFAPPLQKVRGFSCVKMVFGV